MTSPKQSLSANVPREYRRFYSLNLLLARYQPLENLERDEAIIENRQSCKYYTTRDFSPHRFYKHITSPLGPIVGTEPQLDAAPDVTEPALPPVAPPDPSSYFVSWACCLPVEGHTRSIVCDLQRGSFAFIPNIVVDILALCRNKTLEEVYAYYEHQQDAQIQEYLAYLVAHDFGFFSTTPQRFPEMS